MKRLRGGSRLAVDPASLPDDWPTFPETASVQAFRWQEATIGGRGLLHFCGECRRATLLRFYADGNRLPAEVPSVLASFRDHGLNSGPSLAVYDIIATLPGRLPLSAFQFDAGRFTIDFGRAGGERVTLWRLSPAKLLPQRHANDLSAIARFNGLLPSNGRAAADQAIEDGLQWRWRPRGASQRLKAFFRGRRAPAGSILRIWHPRPTNRLLAVRAEGLGGDEDFERICEAYGVL